MSKEVKPKKERAENYEEKLSFNGTFEDMIKISTTGAGAKKTKDMKFNIGDIVCKTDGSKNIYKVVATKQGKEAASIPKGFDYAIAIEGNDKYEFVFEDDIDFI